MKFNFIIIPLLSFLFAYFWYKFSKPWFESFYHSSLQKKLFVKLNLNSFIEVAIFIYGIYIVGFLWFWNIPIFTFWQYLTGGVVLIFCSLTLFCAKNYQTNKTQFNIKNIMLLLQVLLVAILVLVAFKTLIALIFLIPCSLLCLLILNSLKNKTNYE